MVVTGMTGPHATRVASLPKRRSKGFVNLLQPPQGVDEGVVAMSSEASKALVEVSVDVILACPCVLVGWRWQGFRHGHLRDAGTVWSRWASGR